MEQVASSPSRCNMIVATHNEGSVLRALSKMSSLGILPTDNTVVFGQIYGMAFNISVKLGKFIFSVNQLYEEDKTSLLFFQQPLKDTLFTTPFHTVRSSTCCRTYHDELLRIALCLKEQDENGLSSQKKSEPVFLEFRLSLGNQMKVTISSYYAEHNW